MHRLNIIVLFFFCLIWATVHSQFLPFGGFPNDNFGGPRGHMPPMERMPNFQGPPHMMYNGFNNFMCQYVCKNFDSNGDLGTSTDSALADGGSTSNTILGSQD
ncbi:unnamed protein product [Callosobruchus maculatus]|uniref:Uncharacterized protein n=1 Tax=Callosobruchus maculatus TaxID=64391 RepID=A0A653CDK0_CALMS|nr:unnamed protein product [Callosobruchus maculatus]